MMNSARILVAEDQEDAVEILKLAFRRVGAQVLLDFVPDGEAAIDYFTKALGHGGGTTIPRLLLLDLKMPRVDGFQVLEWLRLQPGLQRLLVVVLTSSGELQDINRAYELGANSFVIKPNDFGKLEELVRELEKYWMTFNVCPDCTAVPRSLRQTRVLIRDSQSGAYYQGASQWTKDKSLALNFERAERALKALPGMKLSSSEMIIEVAREPSNVRRATDVSEKGI